MTRTIVVPLDRSRLAESALPLARQLAGRTNSHILLASVIPVPLDLALWCRSAPLAHEWVLRCKDVQRYLGEVGRGMEAGDIDTTFRSGNPAAEIVELVRHTDRPLIVMASHGHTGFRRMVVGSVAAQIVHSAPCPVVVVRALEDGPSPAPPPPDCLLVTLDGSPFAEAALGAAREIFGMSELKLHLIRVVETSKWYMGGSEGSDESSLAAYSASDAYRKWARDEASSYLERVAGELIDEGNTVTCHISDGQAAAQILRTAEEQDAGLIVMSTHGRAGLGRIMMGSVAEQVLHESSLPLLLVRPAEGSAG